VVWWDCLRNLARCALLLSQLSLLLAKPNKPQVRAFEARIEANPPQSGKCWQAQAKVRTCTLPKDVQAAAGAFVLLWLPTGLDGRVQLRLRRILRMELLEEEADVLAVRGELSTSAEPAAFQSAPQAVCATLCSADAGAGSTDPRVADDSEVRPAKGRQQRVPGSGGPTATDNGSRAAFSWAGLHQRLPPALLVLEAPRGRDSRNRRESTRGGGGAGGGSCEWGAIAADSGAAEFAALRIPLRHTRGDGPQGAAHPKGAGALEVELCDEEDILAGLPAGLIADALCEYALWSRRGVAVEGEVEGATGGQEGGGATKAPGSEAAAAPRTGSRCGGRTPSVSRLVVWLPYQHTVATAAVLRAHVTSLPHVHALLRAREEMLASWFSQVREHARV
jgi:hypothetical protein